MSKQRVDKELELYRNLMEVPDTFEDGFSFASLIGAMFIALVMVPGAMYMSLLAGIGVGPAAQWVTVILFIEVARRAHKRLKKPEIYILYYMAGALMATPFFGLLWNQFYVTSQAARATGVAEHLPSWFAPQDPLNEGGERTFFQAKWLVPILLVIFTTVVGRLNNMVLGYGLFRIASDMERLPFPMAPIGAQGIMALAEESEEHGGDAATSWRWRIFSIGGAIGLAWGAIYLGLPTISGALFNTPILIFPIPFSDWVRVTQDFLPAVPTGWNWDLGNMMFGMVLPFYAMLGSFLGMALRVGANVGLYRYEVLRSWQPGMSTIETQFLNQMDFYFSFGIGLALALAVVGIISASRGYMRGKRERAEKSPGMPMHAPISPTRGDLKPWFVVATYLGSTMAYIIVSHYLLPEKGGYFHRDDQGELRNITLLYVMLGYGFIYTPLISYVTARLEGMAGQMVEIPMVREAAFILSGYRGVAVWFLPVPLHNYGGMTVFYRQAELTGTRFWSIWKAELVLVPTVLVASILFANFIWSLAPVPSAQYPYAEMIWEYQANIQSIIYTSTLGQYSAFEEALNWSYLLAGWGVGLVSFATLGLLGAPTLLMYGFIRGMNIALMHTIVPQFIGACISKFYFERKLGLVWRQYVPVLTAGFMCGMGLVTILGIGITFLAKAVFQLPF